MANVYLSEGDMWFVSDYHDKGYDKSIGYRDISETRIKENPGVRERHLFDVRSPYMGQDEELALSGPLADGTVISRDRIVTETSSSWLPFFGEKRTLKNIYPYDFAKIFREKYIEKYGDQKFNIAFPEVSEDNWEILGSASEASRGFYYDEKFPDSIYNSATDLMVVAYEDSLDDSHHLVEELRADLAGDLQLLADRALGVDRGRELEENDSSAVEAEVEQD